MRVILGGVDDCERPALRDFAQQPVGKNLCNTARAARPINLHAGQRGRYLRRFGYRSNQALPILFAARRVDLHRLHSQRTDAIDVADVDGKATDRSHRRHDFGHNFGHHQPVEVAGQVRLGQKKPRLDGAKAKADEGRHRISCPPVTLMAWPVM